MDCSFLKFGIFTNIENVMVIFIKGSEIGCFVAAAGTGSFQGVLVALGGLCGTLWGTWK